MKKLATLILMISSSLGKSNAQYVNIPDPGFRGFLRAKYYSCFNSLAQLDTTCSLITQEDSLTLGVGCNSLEGLKYFKSLVYLNCNTAYSLSNVPELPASLKHLDCSEMNLYNYNLPALPSQLEYLAAGGHAFPQLPDSLRYLQSYTITSQTRLPPLLEELRCSWVTSLPALPDSLRYLDCSRSNDLTSLPELPQTLEVLKCNNCRLTQLPGLPVSLQYFDCSENRITAMPLLPNSLKYLNCYANYNIPAMPALPAGLQVLNCGYNSITSLPAIPITLETLLFAGNPVSTVPTLPNTLRNLDYSSTGIRTVVSLPDSLRGLSCSRNSLGILPSPLPPNLVRLWCTDNQLTFLPPLPSSLISLVCNENNLTYLPTLPPRITELVCWHNNIYCLPKLPGPDDIDTTGQAIARVEYDGDKIKCISNINPGVFYSTMMGGGGPVQICTPVNNVNHCESFPVISGNVFYDNNNNGIKEVNENYKSNVQVELSNGSFAYTNYHGYFEIGIDTIGTYTISPTAPNYYNIVPSSTTYNFTTYDTIVSKDYALQASTIKDSLSLKLTPLNWAARPGFSFPYLISYENAGTTVLSPNISFNYDDTQLTYDSSSNASIVNNGNNLSLIAGSKVPGQLENFTVYFKVKTTVALGDTIFTTATITDNATIAADSSKTFIRGSFDPNDKQATQELSPLQVFNGTYIDYTIRFQNTGTDTAFSVVISDTLNEDLQIPTLQMIASSHSCKTTVKDNVVFFELLNILLPDSNVNEPLSHGFVSFKIKPQTTVAVNTTIPNSAAIYFDYNAPVITNTAGTLIKNFITLPLRLISFNAVPQNDNTTSLYWNTSNELNTKHFEIEKSNDGLRFSAITTVFAKGKAYNNYNATLADANTGNIFYRLKMVDNDGRFTYSPIIKIDKRKNAAGFSILSNPVKDFLVTSTTDRTLHNTQASILNMQGAVVKTFIVKEGNQTVDIKDLSKGVYYLRTAKGSRRVVVQ